MCPSILYAVCNAHSPTHSTISQGSPRGPPTVTQTPIPHLVLHANPSALESPNGTPRPLSPDPRALSTAGRVTQRSEALAATHGGDAHLRAGKKGNGRRELTRAQVQTRSCSTYTGTTPASQAEYRCLPWCSRFPTPLPYAVQSPVRYPGCMLAVHGWACSAGTYFSAGEGGGVALKVIDLDHVTEA